MAEPRTLEEREIPDSVVSFPSATVPPPPPLPVRDSMPVLRRPRPYRIAMAHRAAYRGRIDLHAVMRQADTCSVE